MTCSTCGRDNPAHLTFCQECGQRLGPRIAPPTPPIGLGAQPDPYQSGSVRATNLGGVVAAAQPDFRAGVFMAPSGSSERRCKICDTVNGANLRYCTSCGSTLDAAPGTAPPAAGPSPMGGTVAMNQQPAPPAEIAPMRVVALGENPAAKTAVDPKMCPRCRGVVDPGAQFCKFCGNSLSDAASALLAHERLELPRGGPGGANGSLSPKPVPVALSAVPAPKPVAPSAMPVPSPSPIAPAKPMTSGAAALAAIPPRGGSVQPAPIADARGPGLLEARGPAPLPSSAQGPAPAPSPPPAPVTQQRGRLVVIAKSGADGPSYPFGDLFDVGRTEGNVVVPEDPYLSPRHVRILWNNGKLILRDLGSTNGVYLRLAASRDTSPRRGDGAEIAVPLNDQDMILVGQQVLRFDVLREGEGGLGPAQEHGTLLFGSPAAPRYARLTQRTVEGIARDVYHLRKTETVLGRESGDVVFTEDPFLSRRHAAVRVLSRDAGEPKFALVDLGSSNGTFIKLRADVELAPGDHFRVGQQLFRVDFDGAN